MRKYSITFISLITLVALSGVICSALGSTLPSSAQTTPDQSYDDLYNKAYEYYDRGDYNNAIIAFNEAFKLDRSITDAPYMIGRCYYKTDHFEKAVEWFKYAADRGDMEATYYLAECNEEGKGVTQNINEAIRLYEIVSCSNSELKSKAAQKASELKTQPKISTTVSSTNGIKKTTYTVNGVSFTMVAVEGGTFTMGATPEQGSDAESDEKPAHQVTLSSFNIGQTEVTQALWQAVMGSNPSRFTGDLQRPVEKVSWDDCQTFITKLNQMTSQNFRLPTEAEWEYAARGGNKSQGYKYSGSNTIGDVAWYSDNSYALGSSNPDYGTHPVATKAPNELGLYDMSGNVWEWCQDWFGDYSSSAQTAPTGPASGSLRVNRGGGWNYYAGNCRGSNRHSNNPSYTYNFLGFRLAQ